MMTPKEHLEHIADQADGSAHEIRYTEPWESRTLLRLARELRELAANLPPQPRQETP